jgi:hypothetical protein
VSPWVGLARTNQLAAGTQAAITRVILAKHELEYCHVTTQMSRTSSLHTVYNLMFIEKQATYSLFYSWGGKLVASNGITTGQEAGVDLQ